MTGNADRLAGLVEVLDIIIRLHDRELDAQFLDGFRQFRLGNWIGDRLQSEAGKDAAGHLAEAVAQTDPGDLASLDDLATEFADIYLTHGYRVSPSGSVWLTEDHLERQLPMFDARDWYEHYDVAVPDWRRRSDDHLVHELQFVSFLCRAGGTVAAEDAGRFMDLHLLPWAPEFCRQALGRLRLPLYRAVFDLTLALLEELRVTLETTTGQDRVTRLAAPPVANRELEREAPYVPGVAESW